MKSFFAIIGFVSVLSCAGVVYLLISQNNLATRTRGVEFMIENRTIEPLVHPPFKYEDWMYKTDSLRRAIDLRDAKQQYYLTQMDIQSNWYILFVTILFSVFAVVGYGFFMAQVQAIAEKTDSYKKTQDEHIETFEKNFRNEFNNLEFKIRVIAANSYLVDADMKEDRLEAWYSYLLAAESFIIASKLNGDQPKMKSAMNALHSAAFEMNELRKVKDLDVEQFVKRFDENEIIEIKSMLIFIVTNAVTDQDKMIALRFFQDFIWITTQI